MGMFDNITVKRELPLTDELKQLSVDWKNVVFQTKDLDNCLNDYIITEEGRLTAEHVEWEYVYYTEEERKRKEIKPWDLVKESIEKSRRTETLDFHGKVTFYTHETLSEGEDVWVDFEAYFIYGKLDKMLLAKVEKFPSSRLQNDKWFKQMEAEKNSLLYKTKKYLGWYWLWTTATKSISSVIRVLQDVNTFIYKNLL